jgi:hypothetical protein
MRNIIPVWMLSCLMLGGAVSADPLVSVQRTGTVSASQFNTRLKAVFGSLAPAPATGPTDLYKIRYNSHDGKGRAVVLSGLLTLPRGGAPKGLLVFTHGVIADRRLSPSRFKEKGQASEVGAALLAYGSGGYGLMMPDYLGLGDDSGVHPFPLGRVNSLSVIDMIGPARTAARRLMVNLGPRLFVSGYSEGGAVALWTVRLLQEKPYATLRVTSAVPMSGPYDLTGATAHSLVAPAQSQAVFAARLYLLSYLLHSAYKNDGVKLTNYVRPALAAVIVRVFDQNLTDEQIIKRLALAATLLGARNSVERVTTPYFSKALHSVNASDPVIRDLLKNNCIDWSPRTKMLIICLKTDGIVVPENTHNAIKAFRARGVGANVVSESLIVNSRLNHSTAIIPALAQARRFFDASKP